MTKATPSPERPGADDAGLTLIQRRRLTAAADSPRDKELESLAEAGALKLYDSMFGNHYYALTDAGRKAIRP